MIAAVRIAILILWLQNVNCKHQPTSSNRVVLNFAILAIRRRGSSFPASLFTLVDHTPLGFINVSAAQCVGLIGLCLVGAVQKLIDLRTVLAVVGFALIPRRSDGETRLAGCLTLSPRSPPSSNGSGRSLGQKNGTHLAC